MAFPQRRSELYQDALDILLRKWDSRRNLQRDVIFYGKLSPQRKQQMLAHIATSAFEKGQLFRETEELGLQIADYLSKLPGIQQEAVDIDGEEVLREIAAQHGLFVERARNIYSFSHPIFQEYFTARYIAENNGRGTTQVLVRDHLTDGRWREVILLVASMLDEGDDFCQLMRLQVDSHLAQHQGLVEMLEWSYARAKSVNPSPEQDVTIRLAYMNLALARALDPDLNLAVALDFDRDLDYALKLAVVLDLSLDPALDPASALALDPALAFDLDLAKDVHPQVVLDYALYYAWIIAAIFGRSNREEQQGAEDNYIVNFARLFELCEMAQDKNLLVELKQLSIPKTGISNSPPSWQKLADKLASLMASYCDFRLDWTLEAAEWNAIDSYIYMDELLIRCLDLAFVQDRQGFKDGLLLPPGEWEKMRR